eukprot:gnl/Chilomastix_cuspidata/3543.p1 GENE.gnl/Chilomastix_cuspidata/3543~~gnl/Chilomastix_cuspidata/3543.p1  ORF type:complete len:236 (+),score=86.97 gnl/Chilomastix_cuspidata/3543:23-730(+)
MNSSQRSRKSMVDTKPQVTQNSYSIKACLKVCMFVPNVIGFARILFAFVAFIIMEAHPITASWIYWVSFSLDFFDGFAARKFDQASRFGALLDMVTDRVGTTVFCFHLARVYPAHALWFQLLVALDIFSHFYHIMRQQLDGRESHKQIQSNQSPFLRLYYKIRVFMGALCTTNELFFVSLYIRRFTPCPFYRWCFRVAVPGFAVKQAINVVQLVSAAIGVIEHDLVLRERDGKRV